MNRYVDALQRLSDVSSGFRQGLTADDKALCDEVKTRDVMLNALTKECASSSRKDDNGKLFRFLGAMDRFSDHLRPFFDVIDMIISSHPDYAAIAWGGLKLLFLVSSYLSEHASHQLDIDKEFYSSLVATSVYSKNSAKC